jgi:HNH endonuclease
LPSKAWVAISPFAAHDRHQSDDRPDDRTAMNELRDPEDGLESGLKTESWLKELENRLDRVRASLGDAEINLARAMRSRAGFARELSIVQELLANFEDRLARMIAASADGNRAGGHSEPIVYRDIPGFPGYRAGSNGTVWGSRRAGRGFGRMREWRPLKPYLMRPGPAPTVSLYRNRARHSMRVDAVILLAFVGARPDGFEVASRNGDPLDNRIENLRYVPLSTPLVGADGPTANASLSAVVALVGPIDSD